MLIPEEYQKIPLKKGWLSLNNEKINARLGARKPAKKKANARF